MRFPAEALQLLKKMFQTVSEACMDAKVLKLETILLQKWEKIFACSTQIVELVSEFATAGHSIMEIEKKRLLCEGCLAISM